MGKPKLKQLTLQPQWGLLDIIGVTTREERQLIREPLLVLWRATGSWPSGWGEHQPGGISAINLNLRKSSILKRQPGPSSLWGFLGWYSLFEPQLELSTDENCFWMFTTELSKLHKKVIHVFMYPSIGFRLLIALVTLTSSINQPGSHWQIFDITTNFSLMNIFHALNTLFAYPKCFMVSQELGSLLKC